MVNTNKVPLRRIEGINNYKTNCITEIPQNINLELADGVLTLKAGSKVYVPNGFEEDGVTKKFDEVIVNRDCSTNDKTKIGQWFISYYMDGNGGLMSGSLIDSISGENAIPNYGYSLGYDTTSNTISRYGENLSIHANNCSLPFAIITFDASGVASIDQVFNGFGYIGRTIFALPCTKGLIPNGRNEDGSLNNIEFSVENVLVRTFPSTETVINDNGILGIGKYNGKDDFSRLNGGTYYYNEIENINYNNGLKWDWCVVVDPFEYEYGVIKTFNPKKVFKEVDQNDFPQLFEDNMKQKIKVVSDLPSNPEVGVLYYVKE